MFFQTTDFVFVQPVAAYIRRSMRRQDESRQEKNILDFLGDKKVIMSRDNIFSDSGSRHRAEKRGEFQRLLTLIQAGQIKTVIISELDRWGVKGIDEFFKFRNILLDHNCKLFSIQDGDLTAKDLATLTNVMFKAEGSRQAQMSTGYRIQTKRKQMAANGEVGKDGRRPAYGYDKACYHGDQLLWRLHYVTPTQRLQVFPDGTKKEWNGTDRPKRNSDESFRLLPTIDPKRLDCVKLIFNLFTTQSISLRQIAKRLNLQGFAVPCGKDWVGVCVRNVLENPVYVGDYVSFRHQTDSFYTLQEGAVVERTDNRQFFIKPKEEWVVKQNTHEGLVNRETFDKAQEKLKTISVKIAPRNNAYWLKNFLYCGTCKKRMAARMRRGEPYYFCATYADGQRAGSGKRCQSSSISHKDVEKFLTERFGTLKKKLESDDQAAVIEQLTEIAARHDQHFSNSYQHRMIAIAAILAKKWKVKIDASLPEDQQIAALRRHYYGKQGVSINLGKDLEDHNKIEASFLDAMLQADSTWCNDHTARIAKDKDEHRQLTLAWAKASSSQQAILKDECNRLEQQIASQVEQSEPLTDQLKRLTEDRKNAIGRCRQALAMMEGQEERQKAETLAEMLESVHLFFHDKESGRKPNEIDRQRTVISSHFPLDTFANTVLRILADLRRSA